MKKSKFGNPFRIHGIVEGDYFSNRIDELARMKAILTEPGAKLLVYGPRRMGKTSAILNAVRAVNKNGGYAFWADFSTASSAVDMGNRILAAATQVIGRRWKHFVGDLVSHLNVTVSLAPDPTTGIPLPSIDFNLRGSDTGKQMQTLGNILDALNDTAKDRKITLGIALDEFQEIHKFGGETAEWDLRSCIQRHSHVGYILAGSRQHLIQRMVDRKGALYKLLDKLSFGPIDPDHFSQWIDNRMASAGLDTPAVGGRIVQMAGPRTRDIIQVARRCFDRILSDQVLSLAGIDEAFEDIIDEEHDLLYESWLSLTAHQQNVLRAVAAAKKGLTTQETLAKFALGSSGTVINTVSSLIKTGYLIRLDAYTLERLNTPTGYDFDNPFFKAWVIRNTLTDIGTR